MHLSTGEKFTLLMVADLYEKLGLKSEMIDTKLLKESIERGHSWALPYIREFDETDPAVAEETLAIICMWAHIESRWMQLSSEDRHVVTTAVPNWERRVTFRGFGGNDEPKHLSVALFLINHLDRFPNFKVRDVNSHCPLLDMLHRPMLAAYRRVYLNNGLDNGLSVERLIEVLSAPDRHRADQREAITLSGNLIET